MTKPSRSSSASRFAGAASPASRTPPSVHWPRSSTRSRPPPPSCRGTRPQRHVAAALHGADIAVDPGHSARSPRLSGSRRGPVPLPPPTARTATARWNPTSCSRPDTSGTCHVGSPPTIGGCSTRPAPGGPSCRHSVHAPRDPGQRIPATLASSVGSMPRRVEAVVAVGAPYDLVAEDLSSVEPAPLESGAEACTIRFTQRTRPLVHGAGWRGAARPGTRDRTRPRRGRGRSMGSAASLTTSWASRHDRRLHRCSPRPRAAALPSARSKAVSGPTVVAIQSASGHSR